MSLWWEQNIEKEMLDQDSLLHILPYMAKAYSEDKRQADSKYDPITGTVVVFMTCPLQLALTEVGAMLFQGHSSLVFPFNLMTERQKTFLRECLSRREEWNIYNNTVVFRKRKGQPDRVLAPASVLTSLCQKVLCGGKAHPSQKQRIAVCNIILQRVQGYVPIDKNVQRQLNEWLASATEAADIKEKAPAGQAA